LERRATMTRDQEIVDKVVDEWSRGTESEIIVPAILEVLRRFGIMLGDRLTVDVCCRILGRMSELALRIRSELMEKRVKS
jgi:hypothetical protein